MVLEAAFFSPTSMISPSLVPTRILPCQRVGGYSSCHWNHNNIKHHGPSTVCSSHLSSADRSDALHRLAGLQLKSSAALHLLVPKLHSTTLFGPDEQQQTAGFHVFYIHQRNPEEGYIPKMDLSEPSSSPGVTFNLYPCLWPVHTVYSRVSQPLWCGRLSDST